MKKFKIKRLPTQQNVYLKNRIVKTRGRARAVGIVYAVSTLLLIVAACFPLLETEQTGLGVAAVWKSFSLASWKDFGTLKDVFPLTNAFLYVLMLVILLVNLVRTGLTFRNLFKRKASKKYGFNSNVNAMHSMGDAFSNIFYVVIWMHFVIYALGGEAKLKPLAFVVLGYGICVHFVCGLLGGRASFFDVDEEGRMFERRRIVKYFPPIFRNLSQLLSTFALIYLFLRTSRICESIEPLLDIEVWKVHFRANVMSFASLILQSVTMFSLSVLLKHATGTAEFDIDGRRASRETNFRVFAFYVMVTSGATCFCRYFFGEVAFVSDFKGALMVKASSWMDYYSLIMAALALAMFIVENVMQDVPSKGALHNERAAEETDSYEEEGEELACEADMDTLFTENPESEMENPKNAEQNA